METLLDKLIALDEQHHSAPNKAAIQMLLVVQDYLAGLALAKPFQDLTFDDVIARAAGKFQPALPPDLSPGPPLRRR